MEAGNQHKPFRRALICLLVLAPCVAAGEPNTLSKEEKKLGFRLLFDGRSMAQWRNIRSKTIPAGTSQKSVPRPPQAPRP